jgi:uncharacterized protein with FMN-binding domain
MLNRTHNSVLLAHILLTLPLAGVLGLGSADAAGVSYKDGNYTGTTDVEWGAITIKVTIQGGKITDVQFLKMPDDRARSVEITEFVSPILKSEAIAAQDAKVNVVSTATTSSIGFRVALAAALNAANK